MNDTKITGIFLATAVVLAGAATWASIPNTRSIEEFNDQGKKFFPDFEDPNAATSLEVIEVDPKTALAKVLKVELKNGRWVIPSHNNYPADAKDRLARTAGRVVGLVKDTIRSSRSEDHAELGVIDPKSAKLSTIEGVGKRIILKDKNDRILADYIIGKEVKGHPDQKYVRQPEKGQVRTYGVKLAAEPSTRFSDWIETNLLKLDSTKLRSVEIDTTKVDANKSIRQGDLLALTRKDASAPWSTEGMQPNDEVDPTKMSALLSTLGDLKIVGVRPKPAGLSAELKAAGEGGGLQIDREGRESLARRGFYFDKSGELFSDEGGLVARTDDGIVYILKFGGVTIAQDEALSAGSNDEAAVDPKKEKDKPAGENSGESRFLFVTTLFRPELIAKPESMIRAEQSSELPDALFQRTAEQIAADEAKMKSEKASYEAKLAAGKAKAAELSARFAPWYYVVPGNAFRSLIMDRASLVHPKAEPGQGPAGPGGFPPGAGRADPFGAFSPAPRGPH